MYQRRYLLVVNVRNTHKLFKKQVYAQDRFLTEHKKERSWCLTKEWQDVNEFYFYFTDISLLVPDNMLHLRQEKKTTVPKSNFIDLDNDNAMIVNPPTILPTTKIKMADVVDLKKGLVHTTNTVQPPNAETTITHNLVSQKRPSCIAAHLQSGIYCKSTSTLRALLDSKDLNNKNGTY